MFDVNVYVLEMCVVVCLQDLITFPRKDGKSQVERIFFFFFFFFFFLRRYNFEEVLTFSTNSFHLERFLM
jgi:hypothetical protein